MWYENTWRNTWRVYYGTASYKGELHIVVSVPDSTFSTWFTYSEGKGTRAATSSS